jgi:hypothetical protein
LRDSADGRLASESAKFFFQRHGMRETPANSDATRHTKASASRTIRRASRESITAIVSTIEPTEIDNTLTKSFQQLGISKKNPTQQSTSSQNIIRANTMNNITLSQTFSGDNYKPVVVIMYIESVEEIAENSG